MENKKIVDRKTFYLQQIIEKNTKKVRNGLLKIKDAEIMSESLQLFDVFVDAIKEKFNKQIDDIDEEHINKYNKPE